MKLPTPEKALQAARSRMSSCDRILEMSKTHDELNGMSFVAIKAYQALFFVGIIGKEQLMLSGYEMSRTRAITLLDQAKTLLLQTELLFNSSSPEKAK